MQSLPPSQAEHLKAAHGKGALIGVAGSRAMLATPALILDLDALERNIQWMARRCTEAGVALRPHVKVHKSVSIARQLVEAGAIGVCCATLGEAETMARAGIPGVVVTAPIVTPPTMDRLVALSAEGHDVSVVADNGENVDNLARAASRFGTRLGVLVDVEAGSKRTGVVDVEDAVGLARRIASASALRFAGIQAYDGGAQGVVDYGERARRVRDDLALATAVVRRLKQEGLEPGIITGSGTGTHDIERSLGVFTELQPGSYLFTDSFYRSLPLHENDPQPFDASLFVRCTVISATHEGFVITDAGLKALAPEGPPIVVASGAPPGATYATMGDEYGRITFASETDRLDVGAGVECLPPYCATTVGLYDVFHCVRGDTVVDVWPVDARGFS